MLHQNKALQFYTDLGCYQNKEKDFSRPMSNFPVLFKADLIFKDFSKNNNYIQILSSLWEPWSMLLIINWKYKQNMVQFCGGIMALTKSKTKNMMQFYEKQYAFYYLQTQSKYSVTKWLNKMANATN